MAVGFVFVLLNHRHAVERKFITSPAAHHVRLVAMDVPQMVAIFGHDLNGIRVELVRRLRHQRYRIAALIPYDILPMIDACNR